MFEFNKTCRIKHDGISAEIRIIDQPVGNIAIYDKDIAGTNWPIEKVSLVPTFTLINENKLGQVMADEVAIVRVDVLNMEAKHCHTFMLTRKLSTASCCFILTQENPVVASIQ